MKVKTTVRAGAESHVSEKFVQVRGFEVDIKSGDPGGLG
jgi:hypothetical protein